MEQDLPTKLMDELRRMRSVLDDPSRETVRQDEIQRAIQAADEEMGRLPSDSEGFRIFDKDRREQTMWWNEGLSPYASAADFKNLTRKVAVVERVLATIAPPFAAGEDILKDEIFVKDGEVFKAKMAVWQILKAARDDLVIVDEYLDETVFPYLQSLPRSLSIRLLTSSKKPIFVDLFYDYQVQAANVTARINATCHDRFILADGDTLWTLGTSINGLGKKAHAITRIRSAEERQRFIDRFAEWWNEGGEIRSPR
jgi:hypothetical protein